MDGTSIGPWDLELEVIDVLGEPGCGWNYAPGFRTLWDGRHFPEGMCPFAWNAFAPLIWAQRYAKSNRSLGRASGDELVVVCPDSRHQILWKIRRLEDGPGAGQRTYRGRAVRVEAQNRGRRAVAGPRLRPGLFARPAVGL